MDIQKTLKVQIIYVMLDNMHKNILHKYNKIRGKVTSLTKKNFDTELVYTSKYLRLK